MFKFDQEYRECQRREEVMEVLYDEKYSDVVGHYDGPRWRAHRSEIEPLLPSYPCRRCGNHECEFSNRLNVVFHRDNLPFRDIFVNVNCPDRDQFHGLCDECCIALVPWFMKLYDIQLAITTVNFLERSIICQKRMSQPSPAILLEKSKLRASLGRCLLTPPLAF